MDNRSNSEVIQLIFFSITKLIANTKVISRLSKNTNDLNNPYLNISLNNGKNEYRIIYSIFLNSLIIEEKFENIWIPIKTVNKIRNIDEFNDFFNKFEDFQILLGIENFNNQLMEELSKLPATQLFNKIREIFYDYELLEILISKTNVIIPSNISNNELLGILQKENYWDVLQDLNNSVEKFWNKNER